MKGGCEEMKNKKRSKRMRERWYETMNTRNGKERKGIEMQKEDKGERKKGGKGEGGEARYKLGLEEKNMGRDRAG